MRNWRLDAGGGRQPPVSSLQEMPEFFTVLTPADALSKLFEHVPANPPAEEIPVEEALGRVTLGSVLAPESLPDFPRSTMDGYAVLAASTYGASATLPAYLTVVGEVPMGREPEFKLRPGEAALVHTGGMIPPGSDAVVMIENTQVAREGEIEVVRAVAVGENTIQVGEEMAAGAEVLPAGHWIRPQDVGGLAALGITRVRVARRPRVGILATGDEVVPPDHSTRPGQIRDVNSYTIDGLVREAGGIPNRRGIVPDDLEALEAAARSALAENDALVLSAGSSVSVRDMTSKVIEGLGSPGVLVHGVAIKPGKPAILASAAGKPVFGLPGNPVSALVVADLFLTPALYRLQACAQPPRRSHVRARLTHNLSSVPGREDYIPARLVEKDGELWAEPVFGKSNMIFTLVRADGLLKVPIDANGVARGEYVTVRRL